MIKSLVAGLIGGVFGTLIVLWSASSILHYSMFGSLTDWLSAIGTIGAIGAVAWQVWHTEEKSRADRLLLARPRFSVYFAGALRQDMELIYPVEQKHHALEFGRQLSTNSKRLLVLTNTSRNDALEVKISIELISLQDETKSLNLLTFGSIPSIQPGENIGIFDDLLMTRVLQSS